MPDERKEIVAHGYDRMAGFEVSVDEIVELRELKGVATFQWVLASKPAVA